MDNYKPKTDVGTKLGGGSKCESCGLTAGIAEKVQFAGKVYHKTCFKCATCSKSLTKGSESEHGGLPYCKMCHAKITPSSGKAPSVSLLPAAGGGGLVADLNNACGRCAKSVGMAERMKAANRVYHKECFTCKVCATPLGGKYSEDKNKDVYCDRCYSKTHQMKMGDAAVVSVTAKQVPGATDDPHARMQASSNALQEVQEALSRAQVAADADFIKSNEEGANDILKSLSSLNSAHGEDGGS